MKAAFQQVWFRLADMYIGALQRYSSKKPGWRLLAKAIVIY